MEKELRPARVMVMMPPQDCLDFPGTVAVHAKSEGSVDKAAMDWLT